jgi:Rha family phage regulatory protein
MKHATNSNDLIALSGSTLVTSSIKLARYFHKRHSHVLRAIRNLECSPGFRERNFGLTMIDVAGPKGATRQEPAFTITKDGFAFLAMGFTGKEASRWKEAYIEAFNAMAESIANQEKNLWQQMQALIAREVESKVRASFGSHLMLQRKRELPYFADERDRLESEIQPNLFVH